MVLRALILSWPFLKRAFFGDQSFKDFLLKNKQLTIIFTLLLLSVIIAVYSLKSYVKLQEEYKLLNCKYDKIINNT